MVVEHDEQPHHAHAYKEQQVYVQQFVHSHLVLTHHVFVALRDTPAVAVLFKEEDAAGHPKQPCRHPAPGFFLDPILLIHVEERVSAEVALDGYELGEVHLSAQ